VDEQAASARGHAIEGLPNHLAGLYLRWITHLAKDDKKTPSEVASVFEAPGSIPISYAKRYPPLTEQRSSSSSSSPGGNHGFISWDRWESRHKRAFEPAVQPWLAPFCPSSSFSKSEVPSLPFPSSYERLQKIEPSSQKGPIGGPVHVEAAGPAVVVLRGTGGLRGCPRAHLGLAPAEGLWNELCGAGSACAVSGQPAPGGSHPVHHRHATAWGSLLRPTLLLHRAPLSSFTSSSFSS